MNKTLNNKAWWMVLPVILSVAFSAIMPLMTVVNYSVQDILGPDQAVFVGTEWFKEVMRDESLHSAFFRQLWFSLAVLAIEIPLGIGIALCMPAQGWRASLSLVVLPKEPIPEWLNTRTPAGGVAGATVLPEPTRR